MGIENVKPVNGQSTTAIILSTRSTRISELEVVIAIVLAWTHFLVETESPSKWPSRDNSITTYNKHFTHINKKSSSSNIELKNCTISH